jgi:S1-C subfamily serine protease
MRTRLAGALVSAVLGLSTLACAGPPGFVEEPVPPSSTGSSSSPTSAAGTPTRSPGPTGRPSGPARTTSSDAALTPAVRGDVRGIVRVVGVAAACSVEQEGSGFVVAPDHVVTNAHVVQGLRSPRVQVGGTGNRYRAQVVLFDPGIDVALLDVPGLPAASLPASRAPLPTGALVVAAGFPLGGPFTLTPGRVVTQATQAGPKVGTAPARPRPIYEISATVKPGNSGGPLLTPDGRVAGLVFARSTTPVRAGFAISAPAVLDAVNGALHATDPVPTGHC